MTIFNSTIQSHTFTNGKVISLVFDEYFNPKSPISNSIKTLIFGHDYLLNFNPKVKIPNSVKTLTWNCNKKVKIPNSIKTLTLGW